MTGERAADREFGRDPFDILSMPSDKPPRDTTHPDKAISVTGKIAGVALHHAIDLAAVLAVAGLAIDILHLPKDRDLGLGAGHQHHDARTDYGPELAMVPALAPPAVEGGVGLPDDGVAGQPLADVASKKGLSLREI